jgi:hypothetical protein
VSKFTTSKTAEPYNFRHLRRWIEQTYRPQVLPQSDGIFMAYGLPNGHTVVVPGRSADSRQVASGTVKKIAAEIGLTYEELREAVGFPIIKHSKPTRKIEVKARKGCTKGEVVAQAKAVHRSLNELEHAIKCGDRDPAFYLRLHERLTSALAETQAAIHQTTTRGAA